MGRPKGSKNKEVKDAKEEVVPVKVVIVPKKVISCKECGHGKDMHYDGLKGHCNTKDCVCLEHK